MQNSSNSQASVYPVQFGLQFQRAATEEVGLWGSEVRLGFRPFVYERVGYLPSSLSRLSRKGPGSFPFFFINKWPPYKHLMARLSQAYGHLFLLRCPWDIKCGKGLKCKGTLVYVSHFLQFVGFVCRTKTMHRLLCLNFSRPNFLTTLCSHLDVTCSCYFWSTF